MAKKLFIFGIGGTGSRVIKSLTMLLAAGVKLENDFDTVVPIIIDPDIENGDLTRTKNVLKLYQEIRSRVKNPDDFFRQELKTVHELSEPTEGGANPDLFQFKLKDVDSTTFGQYIGFNSLSDEYSNAKDDKAFVKLLYSNSNLNSDLSIGFKGNPNMGSIVLNQFTNSEEFQRFGQVFGPHDAIFIVNSIFGGTGAAGFPLLLKNLRGNPNLSNYAQIKDAPIGGLTYLPYFTLDKKDEINAESFDEKAKIAIDYYNRTIINQRKINVLHFIGNRGNTNVEGYAVGGAGQRNKAHFLELAGAISIIEFCRNIETYKCDNGATLKPTEVREFGIEAESETISFDSLFIQNSELLSKPLSKFRLFTSYLNNGLARAKNVSRWTKSNLLVFRKEKKSPCDSSYFESAEYKNQIAAFNQHFNDWVDEMSKNKPAFAPFYDVVSSSLYQKIDIRNCENIDNLKIRSAVDAKTGKPDKIHTTLIRLFDISTGKVFKSLPLRGTNSPNRKIKVYRLHEGKQGAGWFISSIIDKDALNTIKTEGRDIASSIPSPFARLDLVKSAFDWVNFKISTIIGALPSGSLPTRDVMLRIKEIVEGNSAQNKLISDTLDIAQLFYKYPTLTDKIEIIAWNPNDRFEALISDTSNTRHKIFAETLKLFWNQDSVREGDRGNIVLYNFEAVKKLFFVINKRTKQVIGGTSPATLFFAAPDAHEAIRSLEIYCDQDRLLDDIYQPLHKRDASFVEYFYSIAKQSSNFPALFPEVFTYLEYVKQYLLNDTMRSVVASLSQGSITKYKKAHITTDIKDECEIVDLSIGFEEGLLQEKIIEFPYTIDQKWFITCGAKRHLVPVSRAYLERYGIENIENHLKITEMPAGGIEATLTIPVEHGVLQYKKLYTRADIVKLHVHLSIFPFVRSSTLNLEYTLAVIDDRSESEKSIPVLLACLNNGTRLDESTPPVVRNPGKDDIKTIYHKFQGHFNAIQFGITGISNFIIPKFAPCHENEELTFAIDFGTTNTHIEYSVNGKPSIPFDNSGQLPVWQSLMDRNDSSIATEVRDWLITMDKEILPYNISKEQSNIRFPLRTAIVFNKDYTFSKAQPYKLLQHVNNYLLYENQTVPLYLKSDTQLKWSNYSSDKDELKVEAYIEYLLTIVFNKALALGANPLKTKVIWFYPVSMEGAEGSDGELGIFIRIWKTAYQKVFSTTDTRNLIQVPESVAPYLYYKPKVAGLSLSIDIGGGSSDLALFNESSQNAILISSFKFAGNAIFGDGYNTQGEKSNSDQNGWVRAFEGEAKAAVSKTYKGILDDILQRKDSEDFSSFLFYLEKDSSNNFRYSRLIEKNKKLKLSIFVFYGAIAYYSANLLRKSGITEIPKYILLSGTASKTANILDSSSEGLSNLASLFKFIFEKVFDQVTTREFSIRVEPDPKELTCKGALLSGITESIVQNKIKFWIGGKANDLWGRSLDKTLDVENTPRYQDVLNNNEAKENVCSSVKDFFSLLDAYVASVRFNEKFLIDQDAYDLFVKIRDNDIIDFLTRGLKAFHKKEQRHIEETLFFYPLIGMLNKLTYELSKMDH